MKKFIVFLLLLIQPAFADYIISDTPNACVDIDSNNHTTMLALFTKNSHTCNAGYFLPAGVDECRACGVGYTCPGGTYSFNETTSQGIDFVYPVEQSTPNACVKDLMAINTNNHSNMLAVFIPNTHTCTAGQYLPANIDECRECPANSYCTGGTYTFKETTDQGATACPDNQTSIAGSSSVDDCKTINLTWTSNGETYAMTSCTINGLISVPEIPTRSGYAFTGWKLINSAD